MINDNIYVINSDDHVFVFQAVGFEPVMKMMIIMGYNDDEDKKVNINNNNNSAQWRNDDHADIISSSGVKWRHFRWKHQNSHLDVYLLLICRFMHIYLFWYVDMNYQKSSAGDVSWWIWPVLVFKCVKCYDLYLLRLSVLKPSRFNHVFILKVSLLIDLSQSDVWNILIL